MMPRYHFHLRAGGTIHRDVEGTVCADASAAHAHAVAVADDLLRHSGRSTRHWSLRVEHESGASAFDLFFAEVAAAQDNLPADMQRDVARTCRRVGALADTIASVRSTVVESRMLLARSRGTPQLAYAKNRKGF